MDEFLQGCQGLGLALASGLAGAALASLAGASARLRLVPLVLAAIAGAILYGASIEEAGHPAWPGWIVGALVAMGAFTVCLDVLTGALGRVSEAGSPLAIAALAILAALALAGLSLVVAPVALLALAALLWLMYARRRRAQQKYEGLRVLR